MRFFDVMISKNVLDMEKIYDDDNLDSSLWGLADACKPLFEEFDKKCHVATYSPNSNRGFLMGIAIILYGKYFEDGSSVAFDYLRKALDIWGIPYLNGHLSSVEVVECSAQEVIANSLDHSYKNQTLGRTGTMELYNLLVTTNRVLGIPVIREDWVADVLHREEAFRIAADTRYSKTLSEELAKVYSDSVGPVPLIPAHYILEGVNQTKYEPALHTLLGALASRKRLPSRHIYHLTLNASSLSSDERRLGQEWLNERFVESLRGGVVVIHYGEDDLESGYDTSAYRAFSKFVSLLREFLNDIQVVFLVPPESGSLQKRIRSQFMAPLVTIKEDSGTSLDSYAKALDDLRAMAEESGLEPDGKMEGLVERHMRNRTNADVDDIFAEWKILRAKEAMFPQYLKEMGEFSAVSKLGFGPNADARSARERLGAMIGLEGPKKLIDQMVSRFQMNRKLAEAGRPYKEFNKNLVFYGSPGTGKTVVARLYGEIMREAGILKEGRVIEVSGANGFNIAETFKAARGSVLFVDEAYAMAANPLIGIADFIAHMENCRDDTVVILAGYKQHMKMLYKCNPGFKSRIGFEVEFPDYTEDQMFDIFMLLASQSGLVVEEEAQSLLKDRLARAGKLEDQGNARYVRKLFEDAVGMQQARLAKRIGGEGESCEFTDEELSLIVAEDVELIPGAPEKRGLTAREELARLIGLEKVKAVLDSQLDYATARKLRRDRGLKDEFVPMHMAFLGNPGTGKTEVARLLARAYKEAGILSVGELFECGRSDLVGKYVGETAIKVADLFARAKGSVVFIDEAYSLLDDCRGSYGDEAINTIIAQMENLRDDLVVIFAGYEDEMEGLFDSNPGFESRVKTRIKFDDYSIDELMEILGVMAENHGMTLAEGVRGKVKEILREACGSEHFGNARFVRNLVEEAMVRQAHRLSGAIASGECSDDELMTLLPEDFEAPELGTGAKRNPIGFAA